MSKGEENIVVYKKKIIDTILRYVPTARIYLFGSRARAVHNDTSDIDIAIDDSNKIDRRSMIQIKSAIDSLNIPYNVDVVDLKSVTENFKKQIEADGI
jgi:uncharacterized protein